MLPPRARPAASGAAAAHDRAAASMSASAESTAEGAPAAASATGATTGAEAAARRRAARRTARRRAARRRRTGARPARACARSGRRRRRVEQQPAGRRPDRARLGRRHRDGGLAAADRGRGEVARVAVEVGVVDLGARRRHERGRRVGDERAPVRARGRELVVAHEPWPESALHARVRNVSDRRVARARDHLGERRRLELRRDARPSSRRRRPSGARRAAAPRPRRS